MDPPRHPGMAVGPRSFSKVLGYHQWCNQDWIWSLADSTGLFSPKSIVCTHIHTHGEELGWGCGEAPFESFLLGCRGGGSVSGARVSISLDLHLEWAFWFWWWRLGYSLAVLAGFTPGQHPWPCCGTDHVAAAAPRESRTPGSLPCPGRLPSCSP